MLAHVSCRLVNTELRRDQQCSPLVFVMIKITLKEWGHYVFGNSDRCTQMGQEEDGKNSREKT